MHTFLNVILLKIFVLMTTLNDLNHLGALSITIWTTQKYGSGNKQLEKYTLLINLSVSILSQCYFSSLKIRNKTFGEL